MSPNGTQRDDQQGTKQPLSFIQPRETKRAIKARGARPFVNWMRIGLPMVALVVLVAVALWPAVNRRRVASMVIKNIPDLVVDHLYYTGLDSKNQPYSLLAKKATRPSGVQNIYDLDSPEGEMTLQSGNWVAGQAQYGRYDPDGKKLWLGGDVQLFYDKGYQFTTDEAQVDLNENNAWGESPVLIQGDFGEIRGKGFRMLDSGNVMIVLGPATASLSLHAAAASDKPAGTK